MAALVIMEVFMGAVRVKVKLTNGGDEMDCNNQRLIPNPEHPDGPTFRV